MAFDGRANIVEIDDDERIVAFDLYRKKKISGTKLGPILGMSDLSTPFKVALELAGIYPGDKANKYIDAGNILEPVIRSYVRKNAKTLCTDLGLPEVPLRSTVLIVFCVASAERRTRRMASFAHISQINQKEIPEK